jgi:CRISPR-associated protein Cmr4
MFEEKKALFIYCVSPVHMGSGSAIGVIDNPIQRERHTDYPMMAGSGIKGAVRHDFWAQANGDAEKGKRIKSVFGPEPSGSSEYAGAISFSDAQLVVFPVRSVKKAFVYVTSPTALARMIRTLDIAGVTHGLNINGINNGCHVADGGLLTKGRIALEAFDYEAQENSLIKNVADWLSKNAMPSDPTFAFFKDKMAKDLVLLPDEDFSYFVRNATVVEPHVRIDDVTGTAVEKGLFYTENLPPESLLLSMAMATKERTSGQAMTANEVIDTVLEGKKVGDNAVFSGINGRMIQIGGDATTGRGQVFITAAPKNNQGGGQ